MKLNLSIKPAAFEPAAFEGASYGKEIQDISLAFVWPWRIWTNEIGPLPHERLPDVTHVYNTVFFTSQFQPQTFKKFKSTPRKCAFQKLGKVHKVAAAPPCSQLFCQVKAAQGSAGNLPHSDMHSSPFLLRSQVLNLKWSLSTR